MAKYLPLWPSTLLVFNNLKISWGDQLSTHPKQGLKKKNHFLDFVILLTTSFHVVYKDYDFGDEQMKKTNRG